MPRLLGLAVDRQGREFALPKRDPVARQAPQIVRVQGSIRACTVATRTAALAIARRAGTAATRVPVGHSSSTLQTARTIGVPMVGGNREPVTG